MSRHTIQILLLLMNIIMIPIIVMIHIIIFMFIGIRGGVTPDGDFIWVITHGIPGIITVTQTTDGGIMIIILMDIGQFIDTEIAETFIEDHLTGVHLTEHLIILVELSADQQIQNYKIPEVDM